MVKPTNTYVSSISSNTLNWKKTVVFSSRWCVQSFQFHVRLVQFISSLLSWKSTIVVLWVPMCLLRQYLCKVIHLSFFFLHLNLNSQLVNMYRNSHIHLYNYGNMLSNVEWMGKCAGTEWREKKNTKYITKFLPKSYDNKCVCVLFYNHLG